MKSRLKPDRTLDSDRFASQWDCAGGRGRAAAALVSWRVPAWRTDSWSSSMPWAFRTPELERKYQEERQEAWAKLDAWVALPWGMLFLSIVRRMLPHLPFTAILHSFCHFLVIISPAYLQPLLGKDRYLRHRVKIVIVALAAYTFHPGGGLYRDAVVAQQGGDASLLGAAALFVRCLVASRALFWGFLVYGYKLPPHVGIPVQLLLGGLLMWLRPSLLLCKALQTADNQPNFRLVANALLLLSLLPIGRPELPPNADVCNPLIAWLQVGLGFLLPLAAQLCGEVNARRRFAQRHVRCLRPAERQRWVATSEAALGSPCAIAWIACVHALTAMWWLLLLGPVPGWNPAASEVVGRRAAPTAGINSS